MRIVIIWHWFIKNLVGTWRRNDVDATSLRRIDVITTSCACWEFGPPLAPQYSKPSYAYVVRFTSVIIVSYIVTRFWYPLIILKVQPLQEGIVLI